MPDYKEAALIGTEWQRCHNVTISNPLIGTKAVMFSEERVVSLPSGDISKEVPGCRKAFSVDGAFPLLDPVTNEPTGQTMSHAGLYQALYSLYMQTAMERDAAG